MSDAGSDPAAAQDFGVPEQEAKSTDLEIGNPIPYVPVKSSQVDEERAESRCSSTEKRVVRGAVADHALDRDDPEVAPQVRRAGPPEHVEIRALGVDLQDVVAAREQLHSWISDCFA